jgi:flagellar protein FlaG
MEATMGYDNTLSLEREVKAAFSSSRVTTVNEAEKVEHTPITAVDLNQKKNFTEVQPEANTSVKEQIELSNERIKKSLESLNKFIPLVNTNLVFEFDDLNDPPIIKVIDRESKELIREIPSKDLDKVAKAFDDMVDTLNKSGALFNSEI